MVNVTVSGNNDNISCQGICFNGNAPHLEIYNSILYGNTSTTTPSNSIMTIGHSLIENWTPTFGVNNLDGTIHNPQFVDAANKYYRVMGSSSCCNKGNYFLLDPGYRTGLDLAGNPRVFFGTNVDMGVYEYQGLKPDAAGIFYVKQGGSGLKDGSSWTDVYHDLAPALHIASTNPAIKQIWVADGFYHSDTTIGFILPSNVKIYGGFPANATDVVDDLSNRPVGKNSFGETIFCPKVLHYPPYQPDYYYPDKKCIYYLNYSSHHIVISGQDTYLDGFIISGGNANGTGCDIVNGIGIPQNKGGGVYAIANAELRNLEIRENCGAYGAGIAIIEGCPYLENISIHGDTASFGGGIFAERTSLYAKYIHAFNNIAYQHGGGIYCYDIDIDKGIQPIMPIFENISIHHNRAENGGGICNIYSEPLFYNALIYDNEAANAGLIYNDISSTIFFFHATITKTADMRTNEIVHGRTFFAENCIICVDSFIPPIGKNYTLNVNAGFTHCDYNFLDLHRCNFSLDANQASNFLTNFIDVRAIIASEPSFLERTCNFEDFLSLFDIAGLQRGNGLSYFGAYELDPLNPNDIFDRNNPFWKSIGNNQEPEKILSKNGSNWKLQTYPNPTANGQQITISLENGNLLYDDLVYLKLFSVDGSLVVFNKTFPTGKFTTDIQQLAAGLYIIRLQTETGQNYTGKLVVK